MDYNKWERVENVNEWTGETCIRYLKKFSPRGDLQRTYAEVYVVEGRVHWVANVNIAYRNDLSKLAYGWYANVPGAMAVAKMRASRVALAAIRKADKTRH